MENLENDHFAAGNAEDHPRASPMNTNNDAAKAVTGILAGEGEPIRRETEEADMEILAGPDDSRVKTGPANADAADREELMRADPEALPEEDEDFALGVGSGDDPTQNEEDDVDAETDDLD